MLLFARSSVFLSGPCTVASGRSLKKKERIWLILFVMVTYRFRIGVKKCPNAYNDNKRLAFTTLLKVVEFLSGFDVLISQCSLISVRRYSLGNNLLT